MDKEVRVKKIIPFLRWAGGKRWLIKYLDNLIPEKGFNNYHEIFLGGGSVFFHLSPQGKTYLNDLNSELIDTYHCVRDNVEQVILELSQFKNTKEDYYKVRRERFTDESKSAARFIFLNQTSFNGIYRVNLKGEYNVPYGYRNIGPFNFDNLRQASQQLQNSVLTSNDFTACLKNIKKGDLVFLDPPYTITHNNNGFFKYNKKLFSIQDQYRLSYLIDDIVKKEAYYILTNAAHKDVEEIFDKGHTVLKYKRASLISGKKASRGQYEELIITNTI